MPYPTSILAIDTTLLTRNEARKLRRLELKKYQAYEIIAKFEGTSIDQLFSTEPTRYLCLTNLCFGGVGGVTTEQVSEIFNTFDGLAGIRLTHGKTLHNKPCELLNGKVLFIEFVNLTCQSFMKQIKDSNEVTIPGLILLEEFVSVELEKNILQDIYSNTAWIPVQDLQHYPIGTGIPPHVDSHSSFGPIVLAFSLESPVIMEFKNLQTGVIVNIDLPERSLMILKDEARYAWSHAIRLENF
ncbi:14848_t:CDS:2, partial [Racocetra fulgida]